MRNALSDSQRKEHSQIVCHKLAELSKKLNPRIIHTFIPMSSELDVFPFIIAEFEKDTTIVAPQTLKGRELKHLRLISPAALESGRFGTQHPAGDEVFNGKPDLILVPGLAFDQRGSRLGYGAGYYDIFLAQNPQAFKLGVCYPFQLVDEVPIEPHDVQLDQIIVG